MESNTNPLNIIWSIRANFYSNTILSIRRFLFFFSQWETHNRVSCDSWIYRWDLEREVHLAWRALTCFWAKFNDKVKSISAHSMFVIMCLFLDNKIVLLYILHNFKVSNHFLFHINYIIVLIIFFPKIYKWSLNLFFILNWSSNF